MPANYPGSVWSPSVKNAGDFIQPADINDAQTEIVAIESGLRNGTAPVNSSNSTVTNLSVTGGSTFAGTIQVTGNSTFAGALSVGGASTLTGNVSFGGVQTANTQPRCRVFAGATQSISSGAIETALTFDSHDFDIGSNHSTASNPTRITVQSTGCWWFSAAAVFPASPGNEVGLRFRKNGATAMGTRTSLANGGSSGLVHLRATCIEQMTSTGDYIEVLAYQTTASALTIGNASSRVDQNECMAAKLW